MLVASPFPLSVGDEFSCSPIVGSLGTRVNYRLLHVNVEPRNKSKKHQHCHYYFIYLHFDKVQTLNSKDVEINILE